MSGMRAIATPPPDDAAAVARTAAPVANDNRDPDVLDADQVAALLGLNRKTIYEAAARRDIPHQRIGRRLLFYRPAVLAWLSCKSPSLDRG